MLREILFAAILIACHAALPPGYEDEIYCPVNTCLKHREQPAGWCGPRTMFVECCDEATGQTHRPRGWGDKLPIEEKETMLNDGWHRTKCANWKGVCGRTSSSVRWEGLTARVHSLLASL